ncbi:hypothetical protein, partial [Escherichia coli]|uniref:hypothetical protein n=1 Tax=Escherichia coli TaxID=562 RepID=UPI001B8BD58D
TGGTADRNRSHWSTSKTPSYTKSVSWQHHPGIVDQQIREKLIKHMKYRRLLFFKVSRDVCI